MYFLSFYCGNENNFDGLKVIKLFQNLVKNPAYLFKFKFRFNRYFKNFKRAFLNTKSNYSESAITETLRKKCPF